MYDRRVKICVGASLLLLLIGVSRLVQIQLLADSELQEEIAALGRQKGQSRLFGTVRGDILDRHGNILATDIPQFQAAISYRLSSFWDRRVVETTELMARTKSDDPSLYDFHAEVAAKRADLERIMRDCGKFGVSERDVEGRIQSINNYIWNLRAFLAWYRHGPDPNFTARYDNRINSIPPSAALPEFERQVPNQLDRYRMTMKVDDIPELDQNYFLIDLKTDDDVFAAQMEFMDINDIRIVPTGFRHYPYGSVAAQTIGWTGLATQDRDKELFKHDPLARYLPGDVCGRRPGVEYVCEVILRGRRGEQATDIDGNLVSSTQAQFGQDVQLTLDIELQQQIEEYLTDPQLNPNADANTAVVVLDIRTGDILALVSLPSYDLNRVRSDYGQLSTDPNEPLRNRAINEHYLPGSSVKPFILIAGLESGAITPEEPISCPAQPAPAGWPNCLIWRSGHGHDERWVNNARNAIKGSCNIYFSHLADRLASPILQRWLFLFGYGQRLPIENSLPSPVEGPPRRFLQDPGQISWHPAAATIASPNDIPPMRDVDKRLFGIGHGNLWATPLQVANAFATLARGGQYKPPRLFLKPKVPVSDAPQEPVDLQISAATLQVVYDGMSAVVNESGGTAYNAFRASGLDGQGVKVYGKTGSTEKPYNAWFAGFTEDSDGAKIAVVVVVEGGQSGSRDAAPLGREVIQYCADAGYVGTPLTDIALP
jgi:penicillin-binding protein 2